MTEAKASRICCSDDRLDQSESYSMMLTQQVCGKYRPSIVSHDYGWIGVYVNTGCSCTRNHEGYAGDESWSPTCYEGLVSATLLEWTDEGFLACQYRGWVSHHGHLNAVQVGRLG